MGICLPTGDLCENPHRFSTMVDVVRWQAQRRGDATAYIFLRDGEEDEARLTYRRIDQQARAIAARLRQRGAEGQRALLVYEPGVEYISAFYGCLYAGVVAVPAYPLDPLRIHRTLPRLQAIVEDACAEFALTTGSILNWSEHLLRQTGNFRDVLATDEISDELADEWREPDLATDTLAFLQYTSGSTGSPKGVMLDHSNLLHNLSMLDAADADGTSGVLWVPPYHDMGLIGGVLLPAFRGKPAILMSPLAFVQRPIRWLQAISRYRGSSTGSPNFGFELCVRKIREEECQDLDLSCWTTAFNGAEPIRHDTLTAFAEKFAPFGFRSTTFCPCYGLAEATLFVTGAAVDAAPVVATFDADALENHRAIPVAEAERRRRKLVSSGRVTDEQLIRIVDPDTTRVCEDREVGEIWIGGPSVAQGYWQRPEESRQTFDAYLAEYDEGPFLRTGDLGFIHNGELFVTGRLKDLIIAGGRNHYPQDIEATVQQCHEALKQDGGAVFALERDDREQVIVVQEVLRPRKWDLEAMVVEIREAIFEAHELAVDAIVLIQAGSLSKTTSGKVQRRTSRKRYLAGELQVVAQWSKGSAAESHAPVANGDKQPLQGKTETKLAELWREVFGLSDVCRSDNFFDVGGHSLLAMQLISRIREVFAVELPLRCLFEGPTLSEMAQAIDSLETIRRGPLAHRRENGDVAQRRPVSSQQRQFWLADSLQETPAYHVAGRARLSGELNLAALEESLAEVVRRHDALRSTFFREDGEIQRREQAAPPIDFQEVDLRGVSNSEIEARLRGLSSELFETAFDLENGPLLRVVVAQRSARRYELMLVVHHAAIDGWSMNQLMFDWSAVYEACVNRCASSTPAGQPRYAGYVRWQMDRPLIDSQSHQDDLAYWTRQLSDRVPLELPTDYPRSQRDSRAFRGDEIAADLSEQTVQKLAAIARGEGSTMYMVLLAALNVVLHRYTRQTDLTVGTAVAGRTEKDWERVIGPIANTLLMRNNVCGNPTFRVLLHRVREVTLDALAHQHLPFGELAEVLRSSDTNAQSSGPLFSAFFALEEFPAEPPTAGKMKVEHIAAIYRYMVPTDLSLFAERRNESLRLVLAYDMDLFERRSIEAMFASLLEILDRIAKNPDSELSQLASASAREQSQIAELNDTQTSIPPVICVHDLIAARALRQPDATAVIGKGESLTYRELEVKSNQLARFLRDGGVHRGDAVGIYLDRSPSLLIALLGVFKAGAHYVPLDPTYPKERIRFMIEDAEIGCLLSQSSLRHELPNDANRWVVSLDREWNRIASAGNEPLESLASPDDLAYVIYTSGSTGRPKGVAIPHRAVVNLLHSMAREPGLSADDVLLAMTTLSFDISVPELFLPLYVGATIALAPKTGLADPKAITALLEESQVTVMQATPATWRMLLESGWQPSRRLRMWCGGEAMDARLAQDLLAAGGELWNLYGPTETTVWSTAQRVRNVEGSVPIGRPIDNTQIYLLDAQRNPVPPGVVGELYIGGAGLAREYHRRPELTAERFVPDPFVSDPEARMYRTGDLARLRSDGAIEYLGRSDQQVKIRGHRIELGEIEHCLREQPCVTDVAVVASEIAPGDVRLVAHVVSDPTQPPQAERLKAELSKRLPGYMLPSHFVWTDQFPTTPNGKIDRKRLPAISIGCDDASQPRRILAPRTDAECRVANIWFDLLGTDQVGVDENFFDVGGHSLLAVRLMAKLERTFDTELPLATLLEHSTIAAMAEFLERDKRTSATRSALVPLQNRGSERPLFCVHPAGGTVFCYLPLTQVLGAVQPVFGLQAVGMDGEAPPHESIEKMAGHYVEAIQSAQPHGPYRLAGWSLGGVVAFEMACQLEEMGEAVESLAVFDSLLMSPARPFEDDDIISLLVEMLPGDDAQTIEQVRRMDQPAQMEYFRSRAEQARLVMPFSDESRLHRVFEVFESNLQAMFRYRPRRFGGDVLLFRAAHHSTPLFGDPHLGWQHWVDGRLETHEIDCDHLQMLNEPHIGSAGSILRRWLRREFSAPVPYPPIRSTEMERSCESAQNL